MNARLSGKIAVVTGAGSGIGHAIAVRFAQEGAIVRLVDLNEQACKEAVEEIARSGGTAAAYACNVADQANVRAVFVEMASASPIDILVNCAGISHVGKLETTPEADFDRVFAVNVKGTYNCMFAVIESMKKTGGAILNMCSVAASAGLADRFAYSMTKGAVLSMTLSVARDYLPHKIRCNCISPARFLNQLPWGAWESLKKWPPLRLFCAQTRRPSLQEPITQSTAASLISTDENRLTSAFLEIQSRPRRVDHG
jgi:NAD(P)-dependent dehydrogenase (short-subunit alcohol dehydrogenase family)